MPRVTRAGSVFAFLAVLALGACQDAPPPELRFGLVALLNGPYAGVSGIPSVEGATMAVDELNAAGGVTIAGRSYRVRLITRDMEDRPDAAASAARALVNLDSVHALIGPQFSAHAIPASGVAEDAQLPMISPMASHPDLTRGKRFVFRLAYLDAVQGRELARYACTQLATHRGAMLYDAATLYGREIARLFREEFTQCGGRIVADETFTTDQATDFAPQLRRVVASKAEVLLLPNLLLQDSIQVRQARALGFRGRFLATDTWDPAGMIHVDEATGTLLVAQWDARLQRAATQRFVARYRAAHPATPPRATAALTYDAILLVADAARRAGTLAGEPLAKAIAETTEFEGAGATYRFAGRHDPERAGLLLVIGRGRDSLVSVSSLTP